MYYPQMVLTYRFIINKCVVHLQISEKELTVQQHVAVLPPHGHMEQKSTNPRCDKGIERIKSDASTTQWIGRVGIRRARQQTKFQQVASTKIMYGWICLWSYYMCINLYITPYNPCITHVYIQSNNPSNNPVASAVSRNQRNQRRTLELGELHRGEGASPAGSRKLDLWRACQKDPAMALGPWPGGFTSEHCWSMLKPYN